MTDHPVPTPARDLSDEEAEARTQAAYKFDQEIKAALKSGRAAMWRAARAAIKFEEIKGWMLLGYETLGEWLADPEVHLTRTTYFRMTSTRHELEKRGVTEEKMAELDLSKVDIVLAKVKAGKVTLEEALDDSMSMGAKDLRQVYYDGDGKTGPTFEIGAGDKSPNVGTFDDDAEEAAQNPETTGSGSLSLEDAVAQAEDVLGTDSTMIPRRMLRKALVDLLAAVTADVA